MAESPSQHILITGASSGLGRALALEYAGPNRLLSLWARDLSRLEEVAALCRARGAEVQIVQQDLREADAVESLLGKLFAQSPIDLALLGAGVTSGTLPDGSLEPACDALGTMSVNATATIHMGALLLGMMRQTRQTRQRSQTSEASRDRRKHLVFISSIAAFFPLASSPAYCAAKSAISAYGRAMRFALHGSPVRVSVVYPGYVDSPMSRRLQGPKPFCWPAPQAAAYIRRKLEQGKDAVAFPWPLTWGIMALNLLPFPLAVFFTRVFSFRVEQASPGVHSGGNAGGGTDL